MNSSLLLCHDLQKVSSSNFDLNLKKGYVFTVGNFKGYIYGAP